MVALEVDRLAAQQRLKDHEGFVQSCAAPIQRLAERCVFEVVPETDAEDGAPVGQVVEGHDFSRHHLRTAARQWRHHGAEEHA